ncbi:MAG TPA: hypothetical protein VGP93_19505 [Polyangiaceae bacterium]|nr:hypothetical protein [Polyangiaceae bacterium]
MRPAATIALFGLLAGCHGSMQAKGDANLNGNTSGQASGDLEGDVEQDGNGSASAANHGESAESPDAGDTAGLGQADAALLGARHDLRLISERATNKCQCLAVGLGPAGSPAFQWKAAPPNLDNETELVVALTSEGQTCKGEPKDSLGASYWGYRLKGNDVVVLVESAGSGRPLTAGGIIPKPFADGQVYIAPASKRTPYGRGGDGTAACKLGNPGAQRTKPLESGEDSGPAPSP